jgi:hypothetical protein
VIYPGVVLEGTVEPFDLVKQILGKNSIQIAVNGPRIGM